MSDVQIRPCAMGRAKRYGEIYASAFSGEPWNDAWKPEDAEIHVRITAGSGTLPGFYEKHGFKRERKVILMGKEL